MKRLLLIRHGKAEPSVAGKGDFIRELTGSGVEASDKLGLALAEAGISPELILSSSAPRALKTAEIVSRRLGLPPSSIDGERSLFDAGAEEILEYVRTMNDSISTLAVCGHNPAMTDLLRVLDPQRSRELSTASGALVSLDILSWREAARGLALGIEYFCL